MSKRAEMHKLLKAAQKAGCLIERKSNGHYRITTPSGVWIPAAFSPSTNNGVSITRRRLRKAGVDI